VAVEWVRVPVAGRAEGTVTAGGAVLGGS
jgi:hypothetical protein